MSTQASMDSSTVAGGMRGICRSRKNLARVITSALALVLVAPVVGAQSIGHTLEADVKHSISDALYVWSAPAHASLRDWTTAAGVAGVFVALTQYDADIDRWIVDHPSSPVIRAVKPFRIGDPPELYRLGSESLLLPVLGASYAVGLVTRVDHLREGALGCLEAQQANSIPRIILYNSVSRVRPRSAQGEAIDFRLHRGPWEDHSFFAGHPANVMSCASFLGTRYHMGVVEPLLYGVVAGVGISRMADRVHWTSDTFLGTVYGYAIGRMIAMRQIEREHKHTSSIEPEHGLHGSMYVTGTPHGAVLGWHGTY